MTVRPFTVAAVAAVALTVVACQNGRSTDNTPITSTTPAGRSAAPPSNDVAARDHALVRVVHAVPAVAPVDVYADDQRVFDGVAYKSVTPYREVPGERAAFVVRAAGAPTGEPLARNSEGLDDGDHYTVFAVPDDKAGAELLVVKDEQSLPPSGKARLRVVNATPDGGDIDLVASGQKDPLVGGVNRETVSGYETIDPVSGTITVRPDGKQRTLVTLRDVHFDAGKSYTVVVVGRTGASAKLEAIVIQDEASGPAATLQ
jgi:hypothetical protein